MYSFKLVEDIKARLDLYIGSIPITLHIVSIHYNIAKPTNVIVMVLQDPMDLILGLDTFKYKLLDKVDNYNISICNISNLFNKQSCANVLAASSIVLPCADEPDELYYEIRDIYAKYNNHEKTLLNFVEWTSRIADSPRGAWSYIITGLLLNLSTNTSFPSFNTATDLLKMYDLHKLDLTTADKRDSVIKLVNNILSVANISEGNYKHLMDYFKRLMKVFLG